jgi:hypothetical protein
MWDNLMQPSTLWLVSPIISLLINGLAQTLSYRFLKNLLQSERIGFGLGFVILLVMSGWIIYQFDLNFHNYWTVFFTNVIIYFVMQLGFSNLLGVISVALRVRILQTVENTKYGSSYQELSTVFNPNELIQRRIKRLIKTGQIKENNGKYYINKKFLLYVALFLDISKLVLIGKKSEFD